MRKSRYDLVLDLQGNVKSGLVTASVNSSLKVGFAYQSVSEWPNLLATHKKYHPPTGQNVREEYLFIAQSALGNFDEEIKGGVQLHLTTNEKVQLQPILEILQQAPSLKVLVCSGSNWTNKQLSKETLRTFLECLRKNNMVHNSS